MSKFKRSHQQYSHVEETKDEAEMIEGSRNENSQKYITKTNYFQSNINRFKKLTGLIKIKENRKQESQIAIGDQLFEFQEDDEENFQKIRSYSFVRNFKTLMEETHNIYQKYSNQDKSIGSQQVKAKNKIIDMIIDRYIDEYKIDRDKWLNLLKEFTHRASESVKPNRFMLDYEIDVKILCNEWGSYKDSTYVNGVVIMKKVIDKRANDKHEDPRILLLSNSLGYVREDSDFTDFQSVIKQENHFVEIVKEKINRVSPDIVIVEGDVNKKVSDTLRASNITIVSNVDADTMKRLERCTQTLIYPSTHLLESSSSK